METVLIFSSIARKASRKPSQGTASALLAGTWSTGSTAACPPRLASAAPCEGFQCRKLQHWGCAGPRDQLRHLHRTL